jgi:hypothetical protein
MSFRLGIRQDDPFENFVRSDVERHSPKAPMRHEHLQIQREIACAALLAEDG